MRVLVLAMISSLATRFVDDHELKMVLVGADGPGCLFSVIDEKSKSVKDFLYGMPLEIEQYIEKYV
jgi:hypothetical protein